MFDPKNLLNKLVDSGVAGGLAGGVAGGLLTNALSGKKVKKYAGSALKLGGAALIGGVAYKAWQNYQQRPAAASGPGDIPAPPEGSAFLPAKSDVAATDKLSLLLVRAMINAAKADGQIDTQESQYILNQINQSSLSADDKAFLFEEYSRPMDVASLCESVDCPEQAAEVYAASYLTLDPPSPAERIYLDTLARGLKLENELVKEIQAAMEASQAAA